MSTPATAERDDLAFWARATPAQRLAAVRELAEEWYSLEHPDEPPPRLDRVLAELDAAGVESLLIGGHALAVHARFTKDADVWIGDDPDNVRRACEALARFGAPRAVVDALPGAALLDVVWMGEAPARIDLMKGVPGGDFRACWARRLDVVLDGLTVHVVSREDLIALKEVSGRPQDLLDAQILRAGA